MQGGEEGTLYLYISIYISICPLQRESWKSGADPLKPALVTYVTAGFPTVKETVDIMLGMEAGGAGASKIVERA